MISTRWGLAAATATALALPLFSSPAVASVTGTATSTTVSAAAVDALCAPATQARVTPEARSHPDTPPLSDEALRAFAPKPQARMSTQSTARALPATVRVPVHVTLVRGGHKGDYNRKPAAVRQWISILNNAYAGKQSGASVRSRYVFSLSSVRQVKNDRWYHAVGNSRADKQMRTQLHRGKAGSLNLYVTSPGRRNAGILGFARFPYQYAANPRLDGVTVNVDAMPGGRIRGYNAGDTLVHEVGHWMGLLHTFQGGCAGSSDPERSGDYIADTPAEAEPNFVCAIGRDTCSAPGLDPVRNFMDYSLDSCMNMFTAGQVRKMDAQFAYYRHGR